MRHIIHPVALLLYRSSSALSALRVLSVLGVWLYLALQAQAAETVSLIEFLERANQQGLHVIHSSDLIPDHYLVTIDPDQPINRDQLSRALQRFGLVLRAVSDHADVVVRAIALPPPQAPPAPVVAPQLSSLSATVALEEIVVTSSRHLLLMPQGTGDQGLDHAALMQRPTLGTMRYDW